MSEKRQTWLGTIAQVAAEQRTELPVFVVHGMGRLRSEPTPQGRFVTLKRRLVPIDEAVRSGIEWTLWQIVDDVPHPMLSFRRPLHPDLGAALLMFTIVKGWTRDDWTPETAEAAIGSGVEVMGSVSTPVTEVEDYSLSDDGAFRIVVAKNHWMLYSRGRLLSSSREKGKHSSHDHLSLSALDALCRWMAREWDVIAYGRGCRPIPLRGSSASANRAYETAILTRIAETDPEVHGWWAGHAVRAADRELPNVFFERQADEIVVSWDESPSPTKLYQFQRGVESLPVQIAIPRLRHLILTRLKAMQIPESERTQLLAAVSATAATGRAVIEHYGRGVTSDWLSRQGFGDKEAEDVALMGTSRHPVVGLLRSSQASSISVADYEAVLAALKPSDAKSYAALRDLAKGLNPRIDVREPWESGYQLAGAIRERLKAKPTERLDVESLVRQLGIDLRDLEFSDTTVLGSCVGSAAFTPLVVLNRACPDASGISGRRITLAHELCHLLFDRAGLRSLARFEGGPADSDRVVDMRANAFAVELLVPMSILIGPVGTVVDENTLFEISRSQEVSLIAAQRHANNLRNRLSRRS